MSRNRQNSQFSFGFKIYVLICSTSVGQFVRTQKLIKQKSCQFDSETEWLILECELPGAGTVLVFFLCTTVPSALIEVLSFIIIEIIIISTGLLTWVKLYTSACRMGDLVGNIGGPSCGRIWAISERILNVFFCQGHRDLFILVAAITKM